MKYKLIINFFFILFFYCMVASGQEKVNFIAELPTPGEYELFASGGWDGNWFVGSSQKWIKRVPPLDTTEYQKAFLGARLGRAKTLEQIKNILEQKASGEDAEIPTLPDESGKIKIGLSDSIQNIPYGKILAYTGDIPLEGSATEALRGTGGSRWFFVEIDKDKISSENDNFIFLFSNDQFLNSSQVAPILAAGIGSESGDSSYILKDDGEVSVIRYFEPAIALKLVKSPAPRPDIDLKELKKHPYIQGKYVVFTAVAGDYITGAWLEIEEDSGWKKRGREVLSPPFNLLFNYSELEPGNYRLRAGVRNWWENIDYSTAFELMVD